MEPELVLTLFDSIWFENQILLKHPQESILETNPVEKTIEIDTKIDVSSSKLPVIHTRSKSDQLSSISSFSDSFSPNSVLLQPHLQTIFSGKESNYEITEEKTESKKQSRKKRAEKGSSKSLTELEFEELKGFMDLGFVFSEDDKNSNLVEIIPGLQRLGENDKEGIKSDEISVERPYLSEAWMDSRRKEKISPLINWKIKDLGSDNDVKQSLKLWAHSVASTVR